MTRFFSIASLFLAALAFSAAGCNKPSAAPGGKQDAKADAHHDDHDADHDEDAHEKVPPTVVLGDHAFHAELALDEATGEVAVLISDGNFKPAAVPEKELFLTVAVDGKPKEFSLKQSEPSDPTKKARFAIVDKDLCKSLAPSAKGARINATIRGAAYAATFADKAHRHGKTPEK